MSPNTAAAPVEHGTNAAPGRSRRRAGVLPLGFRSSSSNPEDAEETSSAGGGAGRDRPYVRAGYRALFPFAAHVESHLRAVVEDALAHPGRLFRAQLAFGIQRAHGVPRQAARRLAIAIEYFHTASLIFDDMPAMDDASERRGHTCPHLAHGEAAATLGALAFIARAYELLWQVIGDLPDERRQRASALVAECVGLEGILDGQAHDLHFGGSDHGGASVLEAAEGKTVSLIRLTLLLPALVGDATPATLERMERLARSWGLGYQALDDFKDCLMSEAETGKSTARDAALDRPNLPRALGLDAALAYLEQTLGDARETVNGFPGDVGWKELHRLQSMLEAELATVRERVATRRPGTGDDTEARP